MTSEKPSASAFKVKTLTGKWWIPGSEHHCYGILTFDVTGEQQLKIIDFLEGKYPGKLQHYKVLHGYCQMGNKVYCVTLFNAWHTHLSGPLMSEQNICENIIEFQDIWFGTTFYKKKDDVQFASFSFGIHNLENWQDERSVFSASIDNSPTITTATMTLPPGINLFEDDNVRIEVTYYCCTPGFCEGQLSTSIRYCPIISINCKNDLLPYYGEKISFEYYWYCVYEFFELLLDGNTYFFNLRGLGEMPEIGIRQEKMELLFSRPINPKQRKNISPHQILIPYRKINDVLFDTFRGFMNCQKDIRGILENLFTFTTTNTYHINPLPSLLFALEGLQRIFYNKFGESKSEENRVYYEEFESKKATIISSCSEELHSFIKQNIRWQVPFKERLSKMLREYTTVFPVITDDVCEKLSKELKKLRNQSAHCDNRDDVSWDLIFKLTRFVEFFHYAIILHNCGMSQEIIKKCLEDCYLSNYKAITEFISERYAEPEGGE